jgi:hypothetical protein
MSKIVTGDDTDALITCYNADGSLADLSTASEVKALVVSIDRTEDLTPIYECLSSGDGADWANGVVSAPVSGGDTTALQNRKGMWEVQAIIGGKKRTYLDDDVILFIKGRIP